jgi:hypothetical protein
MPALLMKSDGNGLAWEDSGTGVPLRTKDLQFALAANLDERFSIDEGR